MNHFWYALGQLFLFCIGGHEINVWRRIFGTQGGEVTPVISLLFHILKWLFNTNWRTSEAETYEIKSRKVEVGVN